MPDKKRTTSKPRYSDKEQQAAAAILIECGGLTKEALAKCEILFPGVALTTLWRWKNKWEPLVKPRALAIIRAHPAAQEAHNIVQNLLQDAYLMGMEALTDRDAWEKAGIRDRAIAWGMLEERRRLSIGLTQHVIDTVKLIVSACNRLGYDAEDYLDDMLVGLTDQFNQQRSDDDDD